VTAASIGVDVGGTKIAAALVAGGDVLARTTVPANASRPGREVLSDAVAAAEAMAAAAAERGLAVGGVGVGVPEIVDPAGRIVTAAVVDWAGEPVEQAFAHLGRVTVVADVRAAALGEARLGAGRGFATFAYVTVGTGISHTLVLDGRPYAGARGAALLLGSGRLGGVVLEQVACGPAIAAAAGAGSAEEVLAAAAAGDGPAARVVDVAGRALGEGLATLVNLLDPEAVVVGGGLGGAGGRYWDAVVAAARANVWLPAARELPILPAALGTDAGTVGAALAAAGTPSRSLGTYSRSQPK
jgi:glucokinase